MNHLHKRIRTLEANIAERRNLTAQNYAEAKLKVQDALVSPAAFGIAFLSGVLMTARKKVKASDKNKLKTATTSSRLMNIVSELSGILMLVQSAKKFL